MDFFSQIFYVLVTVFLLQSASAPRPAQASSKSISIFDYCDVTFLVEDDDWHEVLLDGILFPSGQKSCQIKYTAKSSYDKLNYKVTQALLYETNMEIKLESSSDGEHYTSEENISFRNRPSNPNQPVKTDRQVRLSVNRVSGYVSNRFSVIIEVFGDEYREDNSDTEPDRSLSATATFGITTGACLAVLSIVVVCVYMRKQDLKRKRLRAQAEQRQDGNQTNLPPSVQYTPSSGQPQLNFIPPPYRAALGHAEFQHDMLQRQGPDGDIPMSGDNMTFAPPPYSPEEDKPPSYVEAMNMGLSEVTI